MPQLRAKVQHCGFPYHRVDFDTELFLHRIKSFLTNYIFLMIRTDSDGTGVAMRDGITPAPAIMNLEAVDRTA
jgi:hypothetical protein